MSPPLAIDALARHTATAPPPAAGPAHLAPPYADLLVIAAGNSGEALGLRLNALAMLDGRSIALYGLNNDLLPPRPLSVLLCDGARAEVVLDQRIVLGLGNPRERLTEFPLLTARYARLLRGIPVLETYPRAGHGGHGHPVISALDLDLQIAEVVALVQRALRRALDRDGATGASDWQRLMAARQRQHELQTRRLRVLILGGGGGSMGNAAHHLIPYLVRHQLATMGVTEYELWGVILGANAFTGLTPFVRHNMRALLTSLDHLARNGMRRDFINGLSLNVKAPSYDRVLLLDDPALPASGSAVTEAELEQFLDRSALSLYLLAARGTIWQTVASHAANDTGAADDGRLRYLHTVRAAVADVDRLRLARLLAAHIEVGVFQSLAERLGA